MAKTAFSIFDALTDWSKALPEWQRRLLSLLIHETSIPQEAFYQIFAAYLIEQGLHDQPHPQLEHTDLQLPKFQPQDGSKTCTLASISELTGINALAPGEVLTFGPNLTVIYGPNGAGKSGYARALKAACFTRSRNTSIKGNVSLAKDAQPAPRATFGFSDESFGTFLLEEGECPLQDAFAVFDSSCVRVHIDERNAFQVMPYLFDVFPRMVEAFGAIQQELRAQINQRTRPNAFAIADSKSEIATMLSNLSGQSDSAKLIGLAKFGQGEAERIQGIELQIQELKTIDPQQVIRKNLQLIADLNTLQTAVEGIATALTQDLLVAIDTSIQTVKNLADKAAALATAQFGHEPIQPIGTKAWTDLLSAAIAFGKEAGPDGSIPPGAENARCPLCQQKLDGESADRLHRFFHLVTSDIEQQLVDAKAGMVALGNTINELNLGFFSNDSAAKRSAHEIDTELEREIEAYLAGTVQIVQTLQTCIEQGEKPKLSLVQRNEIPERIANCIDRLTSHNEALKENDPNQLIANLSSERQHLLDQKFLTEHIEAIVAHVADMQWVAKANACLRAFPAIQREVTSKQKTLATDLVAHGFAARFEENCHRLLLNLPIRFRFAGDAGSTDRKIELTNAGVQGISPSDVLSEGEQTAAALADFLTEIELNQACIGVIFDDPVTSMDHIRKEAIADRLVLEATRRQVIVFTHDILFTNFLAGSAKDAKVPFAGRTVWRNEESAPGAVDRLAFPHEYYEGQAEDQARKHLESAKALTGDPQRDALEKACGSLRTAYENYIQKTLFNNVIRRWRENIQFTLDQVYFDEDIARRIHERMAFLSRFIDAHSHSPDFHEVPLTIELVSGEVSQFESIKADYRKARKAWEASKAGSGSIFS